MKLFIFMALTTLGAALVWPTVRSTPEQEPALEYLVRQPTIDSEQPPLLIMLHGVGSNEQDLFSLAPQIDGRFLVVSARGPFTQGPGRYRWYEVNLSGGKPVVNAGEAEQSRQMLISFVDQLAGKHSFDPKKVYFCGFSQGAIMSFGVGLTQPDKVRGIAAFSGRILSEIQPKLAAKEKLQHLSVFVSHGTADAVLPVHNARSSKTLLDSLGLKVDYHEYEGMGHSISPQNLKDFLNWLNKAAE